MCENIATVKSRMSLVGGCGRWGLPTQLECLAMASEINMYYGVVCSIYLYNKYTKRCSNVEQAHVPFVKDDLPVVTPELSAEGNTERQT